MQKNHKSYCLTDQIDENGNTVKEPVIVFITGGERIGYIPITVLQSWIMHHIYAPEIKLRNHIPEHMEMLIDRLNIMNKIDKEYRRIT